MKKFLKNILNWLNYNSLSIFARYHFRKQAKNYCNKNNVPNIDGLYSKEIKKYWAKYEKHPSTIFHRWYTGCNGIKDVRYIPENYFYDVIEQYYNDMSLEPAYVDKGMFKKLYSDLKQPETVIVNMNGIFYDEDYNVISNKEAITRLKQVDRVIIKPTRDSGGGKNVRFVNTKDFSDDKCCELFNSYGKDFIVQLPLKQHPDLAALHKESINTIRVMSLLEDGKVSILSTIIRMGVGDACVDNECSGGINCGVDQDGHLSDIAYDGSGKIYKQHPQGCVFNTCTIPSYNKIIEVIKKQHKKLPYFGLVSWDFTVDPEGNPIMIELNLNWCGLNFHQLHHGPLFGDRTDEILNCITNRRVNK